MFFSQLKAKEKSVLTELSYKDYLGEYVLGIFKHSPDIPISKFGLRLLEMRLLQEGKAAVYWNSFFNRWTVGDVTFTGPDLNEYGLMINAECFDEAGHEEHFDDWEHSEKCFVFFNNRSHTPDINLDRYADLMAKLDISLNANIVNTRMFPIVLTRDSVIKDQITEALKSCDDGNTKVVTTKSSIADYTGTSPCEVLNVTDVSQSDKIQYLNHAHDDLMRRFLGIYGININGTGKMAQQSIDEINGSSNAALVIPLEMLKSRNDTWERFSEVTGIPAYVEFSEIWEMEKRSAESEVITDEAEAEKAEAEANTAEAEAEQAELEIERMEEAPEGESGEVQSTNMGEQEGE